MNYDHQEGSRDNDIQEFKPSLALKYIQAGMARIFLSHHRPHPYDLNIPSTSDSRAIQTIIHRRTQRLENTRSGAHKRRDSRQISSVTRDEQDAHQIICAVLTSKPPNPLLAPYKSPKAETIRLGDREKRGMGKSIAQRGKEGKGNRESNTTIFSERTREPDLTRSPSNACDSPLPSQNKSRVPCEIPSVLARPQHRSHPQQLRRRP